MCIFHICNYYKWLILQTNNLYLFYLQYTIWYLADKSYAQNLFMSFSWPLAFYPSQPPPPPPHWSTPPHVIAEPFVRLKRHRSLHIQIFNEYINIFNHFCVILFIIMNISINIPKYWRISKHFTWKINQQSISQTNHIQSKNDKQICLNILTCFFLCCLQRWLRTRFLTKCTFHVHQDFV